GDFLAEMVPRPLTFGSRQVEPVEFTEELVDVGAERFGGRLGVERVGRPGVFIAGIRLLADHDAVLVAHAPGPVPEPVRRLETEHRPLDDENVGPRKPWFLESL